MLNVVTRMEEIRIDAEQVFLGKLLDVRRDHVRLPNGNEAVREYIVHPGAVAVIPVLPDGRLVLLRQFRYPLRQVFLELPAGKIDAGESPLACGQRELLEETGYRAGHWQQLCTLHPCIGYSNERIVLFRATELMFDQVQPDPDEFVEQVVIEPEQALQFIEQGEVSDAKTMVGLLWHLQFA